VQNARVGNADYLLRYLLNVHTLK